MKATRSLLISVFIISLLTACNSGGVQSSLQGITLSRAEAQPTGDASTRKVSVTGDAQVNVVPDEVILNLGVETTDLNLSTAKSQNDAIVKRVAEIAKARGVDARNIQTDYLNIVPRYQDSYTHSAFIGYFVRRTVTITLKDPSQFEGLLSETLEAGVNYVQGIDFRTTELRKYRDQARDLAIKAAQEKAAALAKSLGREIGDPVNIQEEQNWWWGGYGAWWNYGAGNAMSQNVVQNAGGNNTGWSSDEPTAPGQISVQARVSVDFELK